MNSPKASGLLTQTHHPGGLRPHDALTAAALAAAARGWHVIPLRPDDKRPAFPDHTPDTCTGRDPRCRTAGGHVGWEARATTDPDRIRRAWSARPYNVGVATGPSGLVVVDLDKPKDGETPPPGWAIEGVHDGGDVFAHLCEQAGQSWPATHTVSTASGGTHLYYQHPAEAQLRNTTKTLGWLIDTRAHGGYVVAAGSTVAGRPYRTIYDTDPAPLPGWLVERLTPQPTPLPAPAPVEVGAGRRAAYLAAAVDAQVQRVTAAPQGQRNHTLYLSAVILGRLVAGGELDGQIITGLLTQAALSNGLRPRETALTIASGIRAAAAAPRSVAA